MKKILTCIVILTVSLVGCIQKELTYKDFEKIEAGMSTREVKNRLGDPQEIVTDNYLAHEKMNEEAENEDPAEAPEIYYEFSGGTADNMHKLGDQITNSDDLMYYHYEYGDNGYQNIYLIDDKVVWRTF